MTPVEQGQRGFVLLLAQLGFKRESRPCACNIGKNGMHSRIGRAGRHLPAFSGTFSTFDWRNHHVSPFRTGWGAEQPRRATVRGTRLGREGATPCHSLPPRFNRDLEDGGRPSANGLLVHIFGLCCSAATKM
jgi:hypothetical protein